MVEKKEKQDLILRRIVAHLIDWNLAAWLSYFVFLAVSVSGFMPMNNWQKILFLLSGQAFWLLFKDIFRIGKRIMKIEIVQWPTVNHAYWYQKILRNITVFVLYPIEIVLLFLNRRLGDRLANTVVIKAVGTNPKKIYKTKILWILRYVTWFSGVLLLIFSRCREGVERLSRLYNSFTLVSSLIPIVSLVYLYSIIMAVKHKENKKKISVLVLKMLSLEIGFIIYLLFLIFLW